MFILPYKFVTLVSSTNIEQRMLSSLFLVSLVAAVVATPSIGGDHFTTERRRPEQRRCIYSKAYGMQGADCYSLNLLEIPTYLKTNIEILEASYNRIRELRRNSLLHYTSLKLLYLADNLISHIEDGAFEYLTGLEVVDLSLNAIHEVPLDLLGLPNLRKLYLDQNRILDLTAFERVPKSNSLEYLSMVGCHLKELPSLQSFPHLMDFNVSSNEIQIVSAMHLAPACSLHRISLDDNKMLFRYLDPGNCSCMEFTYWLAETGITSDRINCTGDVQACNNVTVSSEALKLREICLNNIAFKEELKQVQRNWLWIAVALVLSVILLVTILYHLQSRTRQRKQFSESNGHVKVNFDRSSVSSIQLIQDSPK